MISLVITSGAPAFCQACPTVDLRNNGSDIAKPIRPRAKRFGINRFEREQEVEDNLSTFNLLKFFV